MAGRVIAFAMHEQEIADAKSILGSQEVTDAFVVGNATDAQIAELKAKGLIVQEIAEVKAETPRTGTTAFRRMRPTTFNTILPRPPVGPVVNDLPDMTRPNVYLIAFRGPLLASQRASLEQLGVQLLEAYKGGSYSAYLTFQQRAQVQALPFVASVNLYDSSEKSTPPNATAIAGAAPANPAQLTVYDVKLHRPEDAATLVAWLKQEGVVIVAQSRMKIRIALLADSPILNALLTRTEVQHYEQYVEPKLFNDRARQILGIVNSGPGAAGNAAPYFQWVGDGETIAIADTGLDDSHPDFGSGRITVVALGRVGQTDDPVGHGTHVAGSALGNGSASQRAFMGTAPSAKLYFQSLLDSNGKLGGLPADLGDLLDPAYVAGARIHNNSWGAATASTYTMSSGEVDDYVAAHQDLLVVIAAGNEGQAAHNVNASPGFVDWLSLGAPATAKNALTVGASRSDRTAGGYSRTTWGAAWPADFPAGPISIATISGDTEALAGFSSRGPSDDRRIKPDVVAPGTDIVSTKSRLAPISNYWSAHSNPLYAYDGGTSMATPLVSGCAACVREYFTKAANHPNPSAALVKACIINGARWLTAMDSIASDPPGQTPAGNFDQGFGRVDMRSTVPNGLNPNLRLQFIDSLKANPSPAIINTGDKRRYMISVNPGLPLRICLAYTDYPGRSLQNNLNLLVQAPDNTKFTGNAQLRLGLQPLDSDNNVEVVRIAAPLQGNYLIQVSAQNILKSPQEFALVVTGDFGTATLQTF